MLLRLALKDLIFDRIMSICFIAAMAAVIAPLLLLFSLRYGIISNLENNLKSNPLNLEIKMRFGDELDQSFFEELRNNEHTSFVIENTRTLSATAKVCIEKCALNVEVIPTAIGDPVVELSGFKGTISENEAYLSARIAEDLNIKAGDQIKLVVHRKKDLKDQYGIVDLTIKGILDPRYELRNSIYVTLPLLIYMEDYRDGYEPPYFADGSKPNAKRVHFAKARIFAKSIEDLPPLSRELRKKFEITDKLGEIENVKAITRVLNFIYLTIAISSVFGGAIALAGLLFANIGLKEKNFALLRLTGFSTKKVIAMVAYESIVISTIAYLFAFLLYYLGNLSFNLYFGSVLRGGAVVSLLEPIHVVTGFLITLVLASVISYFCTLKRIINIDIASALREI